MSERRFPRKPTNLIEYDYDLTIDNQRFTKLEISPYYEKHNQEYLEALKRKGVKLSSKQLEEKLITDDLIKNVLIPQLDGEVEITMDGHCYQYTYYFAIPYKKNKAYKLIWCLDDNNPHILGIMDCFRVEKFDKD